MQSFKNLIEGAFFHSWQRTAMVLGGLVLALALPITIILTQQQQDLRQRASSNLTLVPCNSSVSIYCPSGYSCAYIASQWRCSQNPGGIPNTPTPIPPTPTTQPGTPIGDLPGGTGGTGGVGGNVGTPTTTTFNYNNGLDHCRPANRDCSSALNETNVGNCSSFLGQSAYVCRSTGFTINMPTDNQCSTVSPEGYIRYCLPNTTTGISLNWNKISSDPNHSANVACTNYNNGVPSTCYRTLWRIQTPECNQGASCSSACQAAPNTCGASNGEKECQYVTHSSGQSCTPKSAPNQPCTINNCTGSSICVAGQCVSPTATPTPTATKTPTPTATKTPTPTSTPTPTTEAEPETDPSPSLTQTPEAIIALEISLPAIASNVPEEGQGTLSNNENPVRTSRSIEVLIGDSSGANVTSLASGSNEPVSGTLTFDPATFTYKGFVSLGNLPTANYQILVRTDNSLYREADGFPLITLGQTTTIPQMRLLSGDIDRSGSSDNDMTIDDYIMFMACFRELEICTPEAKMRADLDDNGQIDVIDLNIMQRTFASREGDSLN